MPEVVIVTAPTVEAITLEEAKAFLRVGTDQEDQVVRSCLEAALDHVVDETGCALGQTEYEAVWDAFPGTSEVIELPRSPVTTVTSIKYLDVDEVEQTFAAEEYWADNARRPARVGLKVGKVWPTTAPRLGAVTIRWSAGYIAKAAVPQRALAAVRILLGYLYEHRDLLEAVPAGRLERVPETYQRLIRGVKVWGF